MPTGGRPCRLRYERLMSDDPHAPSRRHVLTHPTTVREGEDHEVVGQSGDRRDAEVRIPKQRGPAYGFSPAAGLERSRRGGPRPSEGTRAPRVERSPERAHIAMVRLLGRRACDVTA